MNPSSEDTNLRNPMLKDINSARNVKFQSKNAFHIWQSNVLAHDVKMSASLAATALHCETTPMGLAESSNGRLGRIFRAFGSEAGLKCN